MRTTSPSHFGIATKSSWIPTGAIMRMVVQAGAFSAISMRAAASRRVRKWQGRVQAFIVPNGCSTVERRTLMGADGLRHRFPDGRSGQPPRGSAPLRLPDAQGGWRSCLWGRSCCSARSLEPVAFGASLFTALNLRPSPATTAPVSTPIRRHNSTNMAQALRRAGPFSRREPAIVLWSGTLRPVSHINSTFRPASHSSRWLQGIRFSEPQTNTLSSTAG
jgi:hypothetical protein